MLDLQAFSNASFELADEVGVGDHPVVVGDAIVLEDIFQCRESRLDEAEALREERSASVNSRQVIRSQTFTR